MHVFDGKKLNFIFFMSLFSRIAKGLSRNLSGRVSTFPFILINVLMATVRLSKLRKGRTGGALALIARGVLPTLQAMGKDADLVLGILLQLCTK